MGHRGNLQVSATQFSGPKLEVGDRAAYGFTMLWPCSRSCRPYAASGAVPARPGTHLTSPHPTATSRPSLLPCRVLLSPSTAALQAPARRTPSARCSREPPQTHGASGSRPHVKPVWGPSRWTPDTSSVPSMPAAKPHVRARARPGRPPAGLRTKMTIAISACLVVFVSVGIHLSMDGTRKRLVRVFPVSGHHPQEATRFRRQAVTCIAPTLMGRSGCTALALGMHGRKLARP